MSEFLMSGPLLLYAISHKMTIKGVLTTYLGVDSKEIERAPRNHTTGYPRPVGRRWARKRPLALA